MRESARAFFFFFFSRQNATCAGGAHVQHSRMQIRTRSDGSDDQNVSEFMTRRARRVSTVETPVEVDRERV